MYVIKVHGFANGVQCPVTEQYLYWYEPEKPANEILFEFGFNISKAKHYPSFREALTDWRRQRMFDGGFRYDGKPDRPLTAFTVEVLRVKE